MKITLHKQVTLKVATVYMKIKKDVMRSDIQEYLNGKRFNNTDINNRIDEYLREIRVYDENQQLSKLGQKVRQTGLLPTPEDGKYRIWYTENDEYFGSVIMYFQRERPHDKANVLELNLGLAEKGHFLMPTRESSKNGDIEYTKFELFSTDLVGTTLKNIESVEVNLLLDEGKQSCLQFSGTLGKDSVIKLHGEKGIETHEKIEQILSEALSDYSPENKRLRKKFEPNENEDCYKSFELRNLQCQWRSFSGAIDCVKLMPYDEVDAIAWRDYLLRDELSKNYYSPEDFEQKASEINDNAGFAPYKNNLNIPKADKFDTRTQTERWHINAPMDLNPNSLFTAISEIITLQKNETQSFAEIVSRMGIGGQNDIVVYYDKYVVDERKQKSAAAFMDAIDASKKIIITDMSPQNQKSDFICNKRKDLIIRDMKSGIFAQKPPHDRYLIVAQPNGTKIWVISNSLDFIRFNEDDVTPDTQGKIVQSVTFTPITILDKELLNFVNKDKYGN